MLLNKKELESVLKSYKFSCRKGKKYYKDIYVKSYQFDITKTIFDLFGKFYDSFTIKQECETIIECKLSTRRDKKSNKIIPTLTVSKAINPKIGIIIKANDDEAKDLLNEVFNHLEEKYEHIVSEKNEALKRAVENILMVWARTKTTKNSKYEKLSKESDELRQRLNQVQADLRVIEREQKSKNFLKVCEEVKKNKYSIPEERIEEAMCGIEYFDKKIIKQVIEFKIEEIKESLRLDSEENKK